MRILSMDFGTSSLKMSLVEERAGEVTILRSASVSYQVRVFHGDWVELEADRLEAALREGAARLELTQEEVGLVSYDTFSPSMVFMDREGAALHPVITHLDRRSKEQTALILREMGKEQFQRITGIQPFTGGASVTTVLWMIQNRPEILRQTAVFGHLNTYIHHRLTGQWATDPVNASMTGMYETTLRSGWSEEICGCFGIPMEKLPPIREAGTILGGLTGEMAEALGLREGTPVALGSNDTATAQVAAGNSRAGDILNVAGSSEMISILSDAPVVNDRYYLRCAVNPGMWQIFAITASGFAVDWFRREFYRDMDQRTFFDVEFPAAIARVGETGVRFAPYLAGDRQSLEPKRGGFDGLTLDSTRTDLLAAILLGIHEPIRQTIDISREFLALGGEIKLTGGMLDKAFVGLKQKLFPEFAFRQKLDCPILGSALLGLEGLAVASRG